MSEIKAIETNYKGYRFRSRLEARWAVFFDTLGIKWDYETEGYDLGDEFGWYLPDFLIDGNEKFSTFIEGWVDIKPNLPSLEEINKMGKLCFDTKKKGFIIFGRISEPEINLNLYNNITKNNTKGIDFKDFFNCFEGALILHFTEDGILLPNIDAFAMINGGKELGIWPYYINSELTFGEKITCFFGNEDNPQHIEGIPMITLSSPICKNLTHENIYCGDGINYKHEILINAYKNAKSARFEFGETPIVVSYYS